LASFGGMWQVADKFYLYFYLIVGVAGQMSQNELVAYGQG